MASVSDKKNKHEKHKDHVPMALYLNPPNQLVFKGPFTSCVTSPLSLTNPTDKTVAFKVMVTAPKHYCCRPAVGYVKPSETVELQVMVEPLEDEKKLEAEKHKFMIQALFVKHAPGDKKPESMEESLDEHSVSKSPEVKELLDPHEFWQLEHSKKEIMYHKFPVAFVQPNQMTKEQLEATVRELTSRAAAEAAAEMDREREKEEEERREREILLKKGKNLTPEERVRLEMLQALAQIALAKKNINGILRITPPEELVFHGPYTEYTGAVIRLHNPSDRIVYYKVLNTNPQHYMIKPAFGILKPGETVVTTCLLEQQDQYARMEVELARYLDSVCLRDKFMVHAAYSSNATTPIPQFWKNLTAGQVQVTKLKIVLALLTRDELQKEREKIAKIKTDGIKKKEKKTAIEFQEDNVDERILRLAPLHELFFNPPYTHTQDGYVQLFNPSDQYIYYKVFTTMPKLYMLKPSMGMLKPHQGIGIVVRLDAVKDLQELYENIHKLVIQAVFHTVDGENGDQFWKRVDPETIKTAQIRISFRGLPSGIEKMMKKKKKQKKPKTAELADVVLEDRKFRIEPEKELVFKGPFTEVVTSPVTLYNDTDRFIYYKILVNAQKHYAARPNVGVVPPHKFGMVTFMLEPLADYKKLASEGHKICIQYCEREIVHQHPREFWQKDDANKPTTIKIPIGFQPADPNAPSMVPGATAAAALAAEKDEDVAAVALAHKSLLLQADKTAQYFGGPIEISTLPKPAVAAGAGVATAVAAAGASTGEENDQFVSAKENEGPSTGTIGSGTTNTENKTDAAPHGQRAEDQPPIQSERAGGAGPRPGESVKAMDKGAQITRPGVVQAGKPGQAVEGAGGATAAADASIESERMVGEAADGYGASICAMDQKNNNVGTAGKSGAETDGQNTAKSPGGVTGSTPEEPMQSERVMGGAGASYGGSVSAVDQKGSSGNVDGGVGGNQNVGPSDARDGSMMMVPGGNISGSAYAVPNQTTEGYTMVGGSGGSGSGSGGGNNMENTGGQNNGQNKNDPNQGPQVFLVHSEKLTNKSIYMG